MPATTAETLPIEIYGNDRCRLYYVGEFPVRLAIHSHANGHVHVSHEAYAGDAYVESKMRLTHAEAVALHAMLGMALAETAPTSDVEKAGAA